MHLGSSARGRSSFSRRWSLLLHAASLGLHKPPGTIDFHLWIRRICGASDFGTRCKRCAEGKTMQHVARALGHSAEAGSRLLRHTALVICLRLLDCQTTPLSRRIHGRKERGGRTNSNVERGKSLAADATPRESLMLRLSIESTEDLFL